MWLNLYGKYQFVKFKIIKLIFNSLFVLFKIELTTPYTKHHKIDGLIKVIQTKKSQAIILCEFSYGRWALLSKEDGVEIKLCRNSMQILNNLLQNVPKDKAQIYLVQSASKYLIRC
jgi:hypothetical protein